jgi:hypothetical protein
MSGSGQNPEVRMFNRGVGFALNDGYRQPACQVRKVLPKSDIMRLALHAIQCSLGI